MLAKFCFGKTNIVEAPDSPKKRDPAFGRAHKIRIHSAAKGFCPRSTFTSVLEKSCPLNNSGSVLLFASA
jgi:hypothetical protein